MFSDDSCSLCDHVPRTLEKPCLKQCRSVRYGKASLLPVIHV